MSKSTFERMMENEQWKSEFEKGYEEFLVSEFLCQQIRTGKAENVRIKMPMSILHELGCNLHRLYINPSPKE